MLRFFDSTPSGNCYKVRLLLAQLEIPYERIAVDVVGKGARPPDLLRDNPLGKVPKVELDNGRALVESNAILWHFAGKTRYLPADEASRFEVLRWLFFEQNALEPNVAVARFIRSFLPVSQHSPDVLAFLERRGKVALTALDRHLAGRSVLVGDSYTIADIALYAYTHVAGEGGFDLAAWPRIGAWLERVRSEPGHVPLGG